MNEGDLNVKHLYITPQENKSELELLEQIYKKVQLSELVKFNCRAFVRVVPKKNKFVQYPYHFALLTNNIYDGDVLITDDDGEEVSTLCNYSVLFKE